ncbi:hypothetical protein [Roseibium sp. RKSG952]|uniref:hypothetical protein n=1 Tax=Roseibium sp. RKSG952 TaxID=2529384 RepID=UPI0018AD19B0|nr:hypothetical protein [Roseibium sp. RKSG952]
MTMSSEIADTLQKEAATIVSLLQRCPLPLRDEKKLQEAISTALTEAGIPHKREHHLSGSDIVDFIFPSGLVMEVKIKAPKRAIYRQCQRYCKHDAVKGLILATATATGFPPDINERPCWVVSLGMGWL